MGCDGGTIPRRDELVRMKKKPEQKDKDQERAAKWKNCALTQEPLQSPIVACELGRFYNKDSVIEFLLDRSKFIGAVRCDHIKGLKDIKELNFTDNPGFHSPKDHKGDSGAYIDRQNAQYICPVTGLEMSGKYRFIYLLKCACVVSERAIKEVKTEICHKCGASFVDDDVILLNGTEDEQDVMKVQMAERRAKAKLEKKNKKKHKIEAAEGSAASSSSVSTSAEDGPSTSKAPRFKVPSTTSTTSTTSTSKLGTYMPYYSKVNGSSTVGVAAKMAADASKKSIQEDKTASGAYKSLFTTSAKGKAQKTAHWVTFNPFYN
jgi:hypothetical protein